MSEINSFSDYASKYNTNMEKLLLKYLLTKREGSNCNDKMRKNIKVSRVAATIKRC